MSLSTSSISGPAPAPAMGRDVWDWLFALAVVGTGIYTWQLLHAHMDIYEKSILVGAVPTMIWLGWFWRPLRPLMVGVGVFTGLAILMYRRTLDDHGPTSWWASSCSC